jgi:hypothetical protein
VLQDFVATLREFADDKAGYDDFAQQWFFSVVMPEYRLSEGSRRRLDGGDAWEATAKVENAGTGTMTVEIAAARGERFPDDDAAPKAKDGVAAAKSAPAEGYADARAAVTLRAGESAIVTIRCAFEPQRIVVDPDLRVLQLRREQATVKL